MSIVVAKRSYLVSTALGNIAVKAELVKDFSVEDIIRNGAESQARQIQMVNVGKELDGNSPLSAGTIPTVFGDVEEDLED